MSAKDSGYHGSWHGALAQPDNEPGSDNVFFYPRSNKNPQQQRQSQSHLHQYTAYRDPGCLSVSGFESESVPDRAYHSPLDAPQDPDIDPNLPPPDASLAGVFEGNDVFNMNPLNLGPPDQSTDIPLYSNPDQGLPTYPYTLSDDAIPWTARYQNSFRNNNNTMPSDHNTTYYDANENKRRRIDADSALELTTSNSSDFGVPQHSQTGPRSLRNSLQQIPSAAGFEQHDSGEHSASAYPHPSLSAFQAFSDEVQTAAQLQTPTSHPSVHTPRRQAGKFYCSNCPPGSAKSFGTTNDLLRHKRGVHGIFEPNDKIWRCKLTNCTVADKIWPRRDNFVSHLKRMHFQNEPQQALNIVDEFQEFYDHDTHGHLTAMTSKDGQDTAKAGRKRPRTESSPTSGQDASSASNIPTSRLPQSTARHPSSVARFNRHHSAHNRQIGSSPMNIVDPDIDSQLNDDSRQVPRSSGSQLSPTPYLPYGGTNYQRYALTEPTPGSRRRQFNEILEEKRQLQQTSPISPSVQDLTNMGGALPSVPTINPFFLDNSQTLDRANNVGLEAMGLSSIGNLDEIFRGLPHEQKAELLSKVFSSGKHDEESGQSPNQRSVSKSSTKETADGEKEYRCLEIIEKKGEVKKCPSAFNSPGELKKHVRRHERRFGCTFDNCYSKFGTKWEWKRHETNQHIQKEGWRCRYVEGHQTCQKLFLIKSEFESHIGTHHKISDPDAVNRELKACHLEKKWLGSYWCGHCRRILQSHAEYGSAMIEERLEHVGRHVIAGADPLAWIELAADGKTKAMMKDLSELRESKSDVNSRASQTSGASVRNYQQDLSDFDGSGEPGNFSGSQQSVRRLDINEDHVDEYGYHLSGSREHQTDATPTTPTIRLQTPEGNVITGSVLDDSKFSNMSLPQNFNDSGNYNMSRASLDVARVFTIKCCCECQRKTSTNPHNTCDNEACGHMYCSSCMIRQVARDHVQNDFDNGNENADVDFGYLV